jgi:hypothetical protein
MNDGSMVRQAVVAAFWSLPMPPRPAENRIWRLNRHPVDRDFEAALSLESGAVPVPVDGEVLIRNEYLSLDAGTRMWMTPRTDGYQPPLPLGIPMVGLVLGRIVESRHATYPVGAFVRAFGNWADYSCVTPAMSGLFVLDETVSDPRQHVGVLGMNAWTAFVGITETAAARPGETVLVSTARSTTRRRESRPRSRRFPVASTSTSTTSATPCSMRCCRRWRSTGASPSADWSRPTRTTVPRDRSASIRC